MHRFLGALLAGFAIAGSASAQDVRPAASSDPVMKGAVEDLLVANLLLAKEGIIPRYGHVSMRSPANRNRIIISRALAPQLVTPADFVELDLDCNPVLKDQPQSYQERFIHCAVYKARPDVNAVVHSHTTYAVAFGVTKTPMRPVVHAGRPLGPNGPPIYEISKFAKATNMAVSTPELGRTLVATLGKASVVLMRGHGSTVVANSIPTVVNTIIGLEENGKVLSIASALGGPIAYLQESDYGNAEFERTYNAELRGWNAMKQEVLPPRADK